MLLDPHVQVMHLRRVIRSRCDLLDLSPVTTWTRSLDQRGSVGLTLTGFEEDSICSISSLFTAAACLVLGWGGSAAHPDEQRQTGDAKYLLSDQQKKARGDLFSPALSQPTHAVWLVLGRTAETNTECCDKKMEMLMRNTAERLSDSILHTSATQ